MTRILTSTVVRGTRQGDSEGGIYLIDFDTRVVQQKLNLNSCGIDWRGRGNDRGLRGMAFDGEVVFAVASDELFAYSPGFELIGSWKNPYLKHCQEIQVWDGVLYIVSAGYDSIVGFELSSQTFDRGIHIATSNYRFKPVLFDPNENDGPLLLNKLGLNNIHCASGGLYVSGLQTDGMLHFNGKTVAMAAEIRHATYNAQPFRDGVIYLDANDECLRYVGRTSGKENREFRPASFDAGELTHTEDDDGETVRAGYVRGLSILSDSFVAFGSCPSTVTITDLAGNRELGYVNLTKDVRCAISTLQVWPFD